MSVLALIFLILSVMKTSGDPVSPVVTFTPNFENVLKGDSVTLSCIVKPRPSNYNYRWYKDNKLIFRYEQKLIIASAKETDSGPYQCTVGNSVHSYPARLYVNSMGDPVRPVVTFTPNWEKVFKGDSVTISCDVRSEYYYWYKDNKLLNRHEQSIKITYAKETDSGDYQCKVLNGVRSYPTRLDVKSTGYIYLILQAPPYIFEGDQLNLRCHSWLSYAEETETIFRIDNKYIESEKHMLYIPNVSTAMIGIFQCEKKVHSTLRMDKAFIFVQDIFATPEITKYQRSVTEGDDMTLTCVTRLNPFKATTELQFAFYRNGWNVQEFGSSNTYSVLAAQLEDSGNYTCEVRTSTDSVRKMSEGLSIQIKELLITPQIGNNGFSELEGDDMTLTCLTTISQLRPTTKVQHAFYNNGQNVRDFNSYDTYRVQSAQLEDSGNYTCEVKTSTGSVRKMSDWLSIQIKASVDQPRLKLIPNEVVLGDEIVLLCESQKGTLPIHYRFYHNWTVLGNIHVEQMMAAELRLTINSPTMAGPYYCDSCNDFFPQKKLSETANLSIIVPVADVNITMDKDGEDFLFGDPLNLTCSVQLGTSPSFLWLHNEEVIDKDSVLFQLRYNGKVLYIESLQNHHRGTYQCNASNELSPNRTFSVLSEVRNINVLSLFVRHIMWPVLGVLLLVILISATLLVIYRQKFTLLLTRCNHKQPTTDMAFVKAQARFSNTAIDEDPPKSNDTDNDQGDYSNLPSRERVASEDVCYAYIDISQIQAPPVITRGNDDFSVLYSVVKCSGVTLKTQISQETLDSTNVYQNFTAKKH